MFVGTQYSIVPHLRGTQKKGGLADITKEQLEAEAAAQRDALAYAQENIKYNRDANIRAQERAEARQAEAEATARMERAQQTALDAAQRAGEFANVASQNILATSKGSLNKVLVTVGLGLVASYVMFSKTFKRPKEKAQ